jgi:hypothetical protein
MDDNLRLMMDSANDLMESTRSQLWKLEQTLFALYEEAEDDPNSEEIPRLLSDASQHAKHSQNGLLCLRDYITDIAKELL